MDGTDTNEPDCDPFPENGPEPEPEPSSSECETSTFSSCNNIYTPTAATSTCSMVCEGKRIHYFDPVKSSANSAQRSLDARRLQASAHALLLT